MTDTHEKIRTLALSISLCHQEPRGCIHPDDDACADGCVNFEAISSALSQAHQDGIREGKRQAAEIVRALGPATQDMTSTMICDALEEAAAAILSTITDEAR